MEPATWLGYAPYDVMVAIGTLIVVILAVICLIQVYRSRDVGANSLLWAFVIIVVPLFGALLWLVWGYPATTRTDQLSSPNGRKNNAS